jgi:C4-dicarboxylate-specific signal transduction histidine kinase
MLLEYVSSTVPSTLCKEQCTRKMYRDSSSGELPVIDPSKRHVTIESAVGEELPKISVAPIQVQEVSINLITNPIEAMEGNVRDPRLIIHAVADRRKMSIQVIANGPGVDDPENIFETFISIRKKA